MTEPLTTNTVRTNETLIQLEQVGMVYRAGELEVQALSQVDLRIDRGEFTVIAGPSGSGKSTLLNLISGLDLPTVGTVSLGGQALNNMSGAELSDFRRDHIGFVFQAYNLIPVLSARENIEYVMLLQGVPVVERGRRVAAILTEVGLAGMEERRPAQLSGGQQQRVAVARAVVTEPDIVLADEPTANLDSATGAALLELMQTLNRQRGTTFIFSTHDQMIIEQAHRVVTLKDGCIETDHVCV